MAKKSRVQMNPDGTFSCTKCPPQKLKPYKARRSVYSHWAAVHGKPKKAKKAKKAKKEKEEPGSYEGPPTRKTKKLNLPANWVPFFANHCMNCGHPIPKKVMF